MKLLRTREDLRELDALRADGPLTFVPTMGALHAGHLSLVRRAGTLGPVVVSVFVNPRQFGPDEDFDTYPRQLDRDLELLGPLAPAAVFAPDRDTVYGDADAAVEPGRFAGGLCGEERPGHFAGVLAVVQRLLELVRPEVAVFGRKDAQQCLVIAEMVRNLGLPVRVVDAPTVREPDGLAMSSRNAYLGTGDRRRAICLWEALQRARSALDQGERRAVRIRSVMMDALAPADAVDYVALRQVDDWSEPVEVAGRMLLAVAARLGPTRLIDNLVLDITESGVRETSLLDMEGIA